MSAGFGLEGYVRLIRLGPARQSDMGEDGFGMSEGRGLARHVTRADYDGIGSSVRFGLEGHVGLARQSSVGLRLSV
jgi:hypothetical protein